MKIGQSWSAKKYFVDNVMWSTANSNQTHPHLEFWQLRKCVHISKVSMEIRNLIIGEGRNHFKQYKQYNFLFMQIGCKVQKKKRNPDKTSFECWICSPGNVDDRGLIYVVLIWTIYKTWKYCPSDYYKIYSIDSIGGCTLNVIPCCEPPMKMNGPKRKLKTLRLWLPITESHLLV